MTNGDSDFRTFMKNAVKFFRFGFNLYEKGVCDKPIKSEFMLVDPRETYGYTKKEASDLLNVSVRHFDRLVRKGEIPKGRKIRGITTLYWDKAYIDKLSSHNNM